MGFPEPEPCLRKSQMNSLTENPQGSSSCRTLNLGLGVLTVVLLGSAAALWNWRTQEAMEKQMVKESASARRQGQKASSLLFSSFRADNNLTYSAISDTTAFVGEKTIKASARVMRAPGKLMVKFLSGPLNGMETGYSERWIWRQVKAGPMTPYAEIPETSQQLASRRFGLMLQNYEAVLGQSEVVNGRNTAVVELQPWRPAEGATGPARRLFIDLETGLTLRIDSYNYNRQPIMQTTLRDLDLEPSVSPASFVVPSEIVKAAKQQSWQAEEMKPSAEQFQNLAERSGIYPPVPRHVPAGFELEGYGLHRCGESSNGEMAVLSRYTDGINSLTIFAMRLEKGQKSEGQTACDFGPGTVISRDNGGGKLVVMADLPEGALRKVLDSAVFKTTAGQPGAPAVRSINTGS